MKKVIFIKIPQGYGTCRTTSTEQDLEMLSKQFREVFKYTDVYPIAISGDIEIIETNILWQDQAEHREKQIDSILNDDPTTDIN